MQSLSEEEYRKLRDRTGSRFLWELSSQSLIPRKISIGKDGALSVIIPIKDRALVISFPTEGEGGTVSFAHMSALERATHGGILREEEMTNHFKEIPLELGLHTLESLRVIKDLLDKLDRTQLWTAIVTEQRRYELYKRLLKKWGMNHIILEIYIHDIDDPKSFFGGEEPPSDFLNRWQAARQATNIDIPPIVNAIPDIT